MSASSFEIALLAATETEAKQLMESLLKHCNTVLPVDGSRCGKHHFTALSQERICPEQRFDELHWLCSPANHSVPEEQLSELADIIHIHYFPPTRPHLYTSFRSYLWRTQLELTTFWASLYLAREMSSIPGLNWNSYPSRSLGSSIGQATAGWGSTPTEAVASLLTQTGYETRTRALQALLVIESNVSMTFGDYIDVLEQLDLVIQCDVIPTGWLTDEYSGYGLKLLLFGPE